MERAGRLLGKLGTKSACYTDEQFLMAAWPVAVGKVIAAHTKAASLVRDRLVIDVEDAIWQRQLFSLRSQILKRLEEATGRRIAEELQFRVVPAKRLPGRAETLDGKNDRPGGLSHDEAEQIVDPMLRRIYLASRRRAGA